MVKCRFVDRARLTFAKLSRADRVIVLVHVQSLLSDPRLAHNSGRLCSPIFDAFTWRSTKPIAPWTVLAMRAAAQPLGRGAPQLGAAVIRPFAKRQLQGL